MTQEGANPKKATYVGLVGARTIIYKTVLWLASPVADEVAAEDVVPRRDCPYVSSTDS